MTIDMRGAKGRLNRPFVGIPTFLRSDICTNLDELNADIAVLGVPTDEGSPFMAGSRFGPRALREHSLRFAAGDGFYNIDNGKHFLVDEMKNRRIVDVGDSDILPTNVEGTFENITADVRLILEKGAMPVVMGGDHAITYPVVRAFDGHGPLSVIHFDAHIDYAPFIHDLRYTNAHAFRLIRPLPFMKEMIQVGIRSLRSTQETVDDSRNDGNRVVTMGEFHALGPVGLAQLLPQDSRCYVSIDVDALDISLVPGCVSAEPNGMLYAELRDTLAAIAEHLDVVGFDFVEVNPQMDVATGVTAYLGAHTMVEFLGHICAQPRWKDRHAG
ncbi:MAG: agmatinase [SAR324 cluster bacterium]|nr:agmatinase [SAR324 cluster bacterium]MCZ6556594.1 agmatinase [SAR324 cluster bacterium]MCZ6627694.1 agmatinase [SAR324 cluster bacterium]MCZ6730514.1 agmatinase [SAR324 cluster bacterium]MCZ6841578.1 agmatinase [SAR324 cluster bacterium]